MVSERPFWESKRLDEMNREQWESLCDGCAKCCLHKLEDEDSGEVFYTRVVCRYLDQEQCRCTVYDKRESLVPTCIKLEPGNFHPDRYDDLHWMPNTCAYRLLHEGRPLPLWHPLITGNRKAIEASGESVTGKVISEEFVHPDGYAEHIIRWASDESEK